MSGSQSIDRILVALDGSPESMVALETAVSLAASLRAELVGLFVEDINLLRLAGLPFSQELILPLADSAELSPQQMSQLLRAQAAFARQALQQAGAAARVETTFRTVRGQVPLAVLTASLEADLLVLGRVSRPVGRRLRLGSTARTVLQQGSRAVLVTDKPVKTPNVVMVAFAGRQTCWQALSLAASLSPPSSQLIILVLGETEAERQARQQETAVWLDQQQRQAAFMPIPQANLLQLARVVEKEQGDLLVLGSELFEQTNEENPNLLADLACALLLSRPFPSPQPEAK